jgi:hypothetical protein
MWALNRFGEFHRAHHAADGTWDPSEAAASLEFAEGLMWSCLLVTPFWLAVALLIVHLIK